jgi:hypothetical protein
MEERERERERERENNVECKKLKKKNVELLNNCT